MHSRSIWYRFVCACVIVIALVPAANDRRAEKAHATTPPTCTPSSSSAGVVDSICLFNNAYYNFDDWLIGAAAYEAVDRNVRFSAEHYDLNIVPLYNLRNYPNLITLFHQYNPQTQLFMNYASFCCMRDYHAWFDDVMNNHPDWILSDLRGNFLIWDDNPLATWFMDIGNPAYQDYWIAHVLEAAQAGSSAEDGWDGIYIDNVQISFWSQLANNTLYPSEEAYEEAAYRFLSRISAAFQSRGIPILINLWLRPEPIHPFAEWLSLVDGVKIEHFVSTWSTGFHDEATWERQVSYLEAIGRAGRIATVYPKFADDNLQARYYGLASFLLGQQGTASYFYYQIGNDYQFTPPLWFDEWALNVGSPLGDRYLAQGVWQRDYTNAKVLVNPSATQTFAIQIEEGYHIPGGQPVTAIIMAPHTGAILLRQFTTAGDTDPDQG